MKLRIFAFALPLLLAACNHVQQKQPDEVHSDVDSLIKGGATVKTITPVYSQLVVFPFPAGFELAFQNTTGPHYIQEYIPHGESVENWTQIITLTGEKDVALNPKATPRAFVAGMTRGFSARCPNSYSGSGLGDQVIDGHEAFAAILSCGTIEYSGKPVSESLLLLVIKGQRDVYSMQWSIRGNPSAEPLVLDDNAWKAKLKMISPSKLCPIVPGEAAPYPSCTQLVVSASQQ